MALYETSDAHAERRRRVLLTGATGYIAGQLLPAFEKHYELRLIDVEELDASICLLTDDLQAAVEHLREPGAPVDREPAVRRDGNWQAWTRDPDGNEIELLQLSEESPQWRSARFTERGGT